MPLSTSSGLLRRIRWSLIPLALLLPMLPAPAAARDDGQRVSGAGVYGSSSQCPVHFSLAATTDEGRAHGFQRADFRNDSAPDCVALGPSHLRADVTCLAVSGNTAQLKGVVSEATGIFASIIGLHPGDVMLSNVVDTEGGQPDRIFQDRDPAQDSAHCAAPAPTTDNLDRGSIEVHA